MNETTVATYRDINTITAEIRTIKQSVGHLLLSSYIELGRRLTEAKEMLPHGEWGAWLRDEAEFSQSTANNMMNIFREYGADQASLFGDVKSQTLGNLTYSKAVALLQVPAEEREEFVEEHHVEDLSTRELDRLIKEKQAADERAARAEKALESAEEEKREAVAAAVQSYEGTVEDVQKLLREAESAGKEAEGKVKAAEKDRAAAEKAQKAAEKSVKELEQQLTSAREDAEGARRDLQELRDNPQIPDEVMEKLRVQFGAAAAEAEAKAAALEKQLKLASPIPAQFQVHMQNAQREISAMKELIRQVDGELAEKLRSAAKAVAEMFSTELGIAG